MVKYKKHFVHPSYLVTDIESHKIHITNKTRIKESKLNKIHIHIHNRSISIFVDNPTYPVTDTESQYIFKRTIKNKK